jgi:branched-subunit amino acid aminotransferase/4-amino-4-deoxychorismate lyase
LPGTLRRQLLQQGRAVETDLRPDALLEANQILIGNSVRGLVHYRLANDWNAETKTRRPELIAPSIQNLAQRLTQQRMVQR